MAITLSWGRWFGGWLSGARDGAQAVAHGGEALVERRALLIGEAVVDFPKHRRDFLGNRVAGLLNFLGEHERALVGLDAIGRGFDEAFRLQMVDRARHSCFVFFAALAQLGRGKASLRTQVVQA